MTFQVNFSVEALVRMLQAQHDRIEVVERGASCVVHLRGIAEHKRALAEASLSITMEA